MATGVPRFQCLASGTHREDDTVPCVRRQYPAKTGLLWFCSGHWPRENPGDAQGVEFRPIDIPDTVYISHLGISESISPHLSQLAAVDDVAFFILAVPMLLCKKLVHDP